MGGGSFLKLVWPVAIITGESRGPIWEGLKSFIGADSNLSPIFHFLHGFGPLHFQSPEFRYFFILSFYFYILCCPVTGSLMSALPSFSLERYLLHIGIEVPILMHMRMVSLLLCCRSKILRFEIIEL